MLYIFFGDKKLSSGSLLIPDSPYFIGLFLCESDPVNEPFTGRYYHTGGRYISHRSPEGRRICRLGVSDSGSIYPHLRSERGT